MSTTASVSTQLLSATTVKVSGSVNSTSVVLVPHAHIVATRANAAKMIFFIV